MSWASFMWRVGDVSSFFLLDTKCWLNSIMILPPYRSNGVETDIYENVVRIRGLRNAALTFIVGKRIA